MTAGPGNRPESEPPHRDRDFDYACVGRTLLSVAFEVAFDLHLRHQKIKVISDGQECPSYTGKVTIRKSLKYGRVTAEVT